MNVVVQDRTLITPAGQTKLAIADCDIHHSPAAGMKGLFPYMEKRWQDHLAAYGALPRQAFQNGPAYPKSQPDASRRDSWPPDGGRPGSSLAFMQKQHLDAHNITLGVLAMIRPHPGSFQNGHLSDAVCQAMNRWQVAEWTQPEPRLKASILIPYEDGDGSAAEIERWADHPDYVQILMLSRTAEPAGQKRYWPIYRAAAETGLPVGIHAFGFGGYPVSGSGWPSFYMEDMVGHAQSCQTFMTSMIMEGLFEHLPTLKIVLIESGFAWLPALGWRLDKTWNRMRGEVPHVKRPPSEYIRTNIWATTQPMEEPENPEHLKDIIEWIGWDKLMFASDYAHWDFDDPFVAIPPSFGDERRMGILSGNARRLYGFA